MSTEVDFASWPRIVLAPGAEAWWWFAWGQSVFNGDRWSAVDAFPLNWPASIQIVEQYGEIDANGTAKRWVHFRNPGTTPVVFEPSAIVAPNL